MILQKPEDLKVWLESLKKEYAGLVILLKMKRKEIDSLSIGIEKYKNDDGMRSMLEQIIKQRVEEVIGMSKRVDGLNRELIGVRKALNLTFEAVMRNANARKAPPASSIAGSSDDTEKEHLHEAVALREGAPLERNGDPDIPSSSYQKEIEENIIEIVNVEPPPQKEQPDNDLYDKAERESRAQEEFLKRLSRSSTNYGEA
ncbi:MAG TPA: hypothetical protein VMD02_00025 [Candidatus Omnitrophota bacterium]|nr:hypothetical protein [Candidatus Omnitrophota bacterium]